MKQLCILPILGLLASGCIHLDQQLTLAGDNRGSFRISASVPLEIYQDFVAEQAQNGPIARWFEPTLGSAAFAEANGFDIRTYRVFDRDSRKHVLIEGRIRDLDKALASGALGRFKHSRTAAGGRLEMVLAAPPTPADDTAAATAQRELKQLTADMRLSLGITVPGQITKSSAPLQRGDDAEWLFEPALDDAFLVKPPPVYVEYKR
jgi:hypothetical protein